MSEIARDFTAAGVEVGLGWIVAEVVVRSAAPALDQALAAGVAAAAVRLEAHCAGRVVDMRLVAAAPHGAG